MDITPPPPEVFQGFEQDQPQRFPEKYSLTVTGDAGAPVRLPFILAHPSGACVLPEGKKPSPVWSLLVGSSLQFCPPPSDSDAVADCVLWPDRATMSAWLQRWPALGSSVSLAVSRKIGAVTGVVSEPAYDEPPPPGLEAALASRPDATWRRLKLETEHCVALVPASAAVWRIFQDAMKKPKADYAKLVSQMAQACIIGCVDWRGEAVDKKQLLERWPGAVLPLMGTIHVLCGAATEVELGGW